jgi:hypothetical protein
MSHFDLWQQEQKRADELLGQRNELLVAAKKVLRREILVASDDLAEWHRCMRELHTAAARVERGGNP